jgi:hypothetical protein
MFRPTVSRPVCLGIKHPFGAYDQILITCVTVTVLFLWDALSDERSDLSFVCAAGLCQRSLSRVRIPWDLRPYFTVWNLRLPFSSPPTSRRVKVEVFDPASKRVVSDERTGLCFIYAAGSCQRNLFSSDFCLSYVLYCILLVISFPEVGSGVPSRRHRIEQLISLLSWLLRPSLVSNRSCIFDLVTLAMCSAEPRHQMVRFQVSSFMSLFYMQAASV